VRGADPAGARLHGAAIVRLSGALHPEPARRRDVLGFALRMQHTATDDLRTGDQDLLLGTFESFLTVRRALARVIVGDYLANTYHSVTPWRVPGLGPVHLRLVPTPDERGSFTLHARRGTGDLALARIRLLQSLAGGGSALRMSMWRNGRGLHPTGARNGVRAIVYPVSQAARRLRNA
jgi:hypothetical protein